MPWENRSPESEHSRADAAVFGVEAVTTRTFDTPEFRGITFHGIQARSIADQVPEASRSPSKMDGEPVPGPDARCTHFHQ
ncbi:hypothetical protein ACH4VX_29735 [Streptomyces sp. NPDC020731]|uniref:hypothetical protein n=1 Tax=Streptomyces sp. NPDC020731 TaxID=3365085 RepID=UPI00379E7C68